MQSLSISQLLGRSCSLACWFWTWCYIISCLRGRGQTVHFIINNLYFLRDTLRGGLHFQWCRDYITPNQTAESQFLIKIVTFKNIAGWVESWWSWCRKPYLCTCWCKWHCCCQWSSVQTSLPAAVPFCLQQSRCHTTQWCWKWGHSPSHTCEKMWGPRYQGQCASASLGSRGGEEKWYLLPSVCKRMLHIGRFWSIWQVLKDSTNVS